MAIQTDVISPQDLANALPDVPTARLQELIDDAWHSAVAKAPCVESPTFTKIGQLKAILRKAIIYEARTTADGRIKSQTIGPAGVTYETPQVASVFFSPAQVEELKELCAGSAIPVTSGVYSMRLTRSGGAL